MNPKTVKAVLVKSFRRLRPVELKRLAYHLEKKTPILCGTFGYLYTDGKGGG